MKIGMLVPITDKHELQNLLDDFSPLRPELNVYEIGGDVWANVEQLHTWRTNHTERRTRVEAWHKESV